MKITAIAFISFFFATFLAAQENLTPHWLQIKKDEVTQVKGNLAEGNFMTNLSWAAE